MLIHHISTRNIQKHSSYYYGHTPYNTIHAKYSILNKTTPWRYGANNCSTVMI